METAKINPADQKNKRPQLKINKPAPTCPEDEAYLKYIDEHRHYVLTAFKKHGQQICLCLSLIGLPYHELRHRIAIHDLSKYGPEEFTEYRKSFFPKKEEENQISNFHMAWKHHYMNNDHHWEYWIHDDKAEEMDRLAIAEMILDWEAMSVKFKNSPLDWYNEHKDSLRLHRKTRELVEATLQSLAKTKEFPYVIRHKTNRRPRKK